MTPGLSAAARRGLLAFMAVCWAVIGVCYLFMSDARRWQPDLVGYLALATSAFTFALVALPWSSRAYRAAGTFGIGCLLFRMASVAAGILSVRDDDSIYVVLSGVATTGMLLAFYWVWWLHQIKAWHEMYKDTRRARIQGFLE